MVQLVHTVRRASLPHLFVPELLGLVEANSDDTPARSRRLSIHRLERGRCLLGLVERDKSELLGASLGVGHDLCADDAAVVLEEEDEVL